MFICDKCGLCYMHIDRLLTDEHLDRGDGGMQIF